MTISSVPLKPPFLARIKSTNYLLNALTAMKAQEQGGRSVSSSPILIPHLSPPSNPIVEPAICHCP